jgi:hypothetical protein
MSDVPVHLRSKPRVSRSAFVGVEVVKNMNGTYINLFRNGTQHSSVAMGAQDVSLPEALVYLATLIRMGNFEV